MTQLFSTDKSEGVGFEHDSISLDTFCSNWVILGDGQVTLATSSDKRSCITHRV